MPDERLDRLHAALQTPKKVNATIEVVDIPGMGGGTPGERPRGLRRFLADIRGVDAVAHVLRAFENPDVPHVRAALDPIADAETSRPSSSSRTSSSWSGACRRRGKAAKAGDKAAQKEMATLDRLAAALRDGRARALGRDARPKTSP